MSASGDKTRGENVESGRVRYDAATSGRMRYVAGEKGYMGGTSVADAKRCRRGEGRCEYGI